MFVNDSHDLLSLEKSFPYPTTPDKLWNNVDQILAWRIALYISPYTGYNKLLLALYVPDAPDYLSYEDIQVIPGRNIFLKLQTGWDALVVHHGSFASSVS